MEKQLRTRLAACGASGQPVSVPLLRKGLARKPRRCSGGYEGSGLRPVADGGMEIGQRWTSFAYLCQKSPQRTTFSLEKSPAPSSNQIAAPVLQGWYDKEQRNGRPTCCLKLRCLSGNLLREDESRALSHRGGEAGPPMEFPSQLLFARNSSVSRFRRRPRHQGDAVRRRARKFAPVRGRVAVKRRSFRLCRRRGG